MTAVDRLNAIVDDIRMASRSVEMARHVALEHGPDLVAALHAVLDLHQFYDQCDEDCCRYCESCEHEWPCPTAVAIEAALGEVAS